MNIKLSKLDEQATIIMGQSPPGESYNKNGNGIPLLNGPTEFGSLHPIEKQWTTSPKKVCQPGDILFCVRGATAGRLNLADKEYCLGRGLAAIRGKSGKFDSVFLRYVLSNGYASFQARGVGSTFINISKEELADFEVPVLPLVEQRRIADILDRAEALRTKRQETLIQLDELIEAIFIDIFGDPIANPKGWEICSIGSFLTDVTNGLTRRRKESDKGTDIVLRLRDIRTGWIDFSDINRISLSPQESNKYIVSPNDLLFIRVNGNPDYVGRCALFEGFSEPVYFNDHIMRVKTDQSKVDGRFIVYVLNGIRGKREIALHRKTSAGQHTINQDGLGKIEIPLAPLKIQQEFAFRIASIEKLKAAHKASLAELDELFVSLQHRAFRGEL